MAAPSHLRWLALYRERRRRAEPPAGTACPDCGDLLQHHWDDGCARCGCTTSHTEAEYRAMMAAESGG